MKKFYLACIALMLLVTIVAYSTIDVNDKALDTNTYVGSLKCKMCHQSQYTSWCESKHANAFTVLGADNTNPTCLVCHTINVTYQSQGIACESCHGAGSAYWTMTVMKDKTLSKQNGLNTITAATCKRCHNNKSPNFKGFDSTTYFNKIKHWL